MVCPEGIARLFAELGVCLGLAPAWVVVDLGLERPDGLLRWLARSTLHVREAHRRSVLGLSSPCSHSCASLGSIVPDAGGLCTHLSPGSANKCAGVAFNTKPTWRFGALSRR